MKLLSYPTPASICAFSTTRSGGVSTGAYASMNISHYCGDSAECVRENRRRLSRELGISPDCLIVPRQVHKAEVREIDTAYLSLSTAAQQACTEGIDAVITRLRGVCIGISTADCVPILIYDSALGALAAAHAGWRGTVLDIAGNTIDALTRTYGCNPRHLHALIGPSISADAFEVGEEVYEAFRSHGFPMAEIAQMHSKWHIDLWRANRLLLERSGVPAEHIIVSGQCTYAHPDVYFSARRLGTDSGRIYSGILRK